MKITRRQLFLAAEMLKKYSKILYEMSPDPRQAMSEMENWTAEEKKEFDNYLDDNFDDGTNHDPNNECPLFDDWQVCDGLAELLEELGSEILDANNLTTGAVDLKYRDIPDSTVKVWDGSRWHDVMGTIENTTSDSEEQDNVRS